MSVRDTIARFARKHPSIVWRARHFKHFHRRLKLHTDFQSIPDLWTYVVRAAIKNVGNRRWALMADKYAVREEISRTCGAQYLIPMVGWWERPADIDFDALPNQFILKTNNGCGTNIFVHDKAKIDRKAIVKELNKALTFPYPELTGQLHYSLIRPCVIAEKLMIQPDSTSLTDYKIHCVNGEPTAIFRFSERDEVNHFSFRLNAYTPLWQQIGHYRDPAEVRANAPDTDRPECLEEMLMLARKLSEGEEYVRVDFYIIDNHIYFGEMTYTPDVGAHPSFKPYMKVMDHILNVIKKEHK